MSASQPCQIPLFAEQPASLLDQLPTGFDPDLPTEEKMEAVVCLLRGYMQKGYVMNCAASFGKDSSVLLALVLEAARRMVQDGQKCPPVMILHSDTRVENPEIWFHARAEIARVQAYAHQHDLPVRIEIAAPSLSEDYLVTMIGGRTIATTADNDAKCSVNMKVRPLQRLKKKLSKEMAAQGFNRSMVLTGKRWDESAARKQDMMRSGEVPWEPVVRNGELMLSAIAHFSLDDVYTMIGLVRSGLFQTYSDFDDLVRVYKGANGGACMVLAVEGQASATGCGQRFGCWNCMRVATDRSMEEMLGQEQYSYMRPLNRLRNYILHRHHDPAYRNWLGRSLDDQGRVAISPNAYSPDFCEELLWYALSIQADEYDWAQQNQQSPRFHLLNDVQLMAIEVHWLRYGYHHQFQAHRILRRVEAGERRYPPNVASNTKTKTLRGTGQKVAFVDVQFGSAFAGLRDGMLAVVDDERTIDKMGQTYANVRADGFEIDPEGLALFHEFELEYYLQRYSDMDVSPGAALMALLRLGVVSIPKGGHQLYDRMIRMGNQIHALGLREVLSDPVALEAKISAGVCRADLLENSSSTF